MHNICPVTLYHGTSSIFLPSILENGLGGINAVKEWGILDLAREIFPYVEENFKDDYRFDSFKKMVKQEVYSIAQNYQHGDVYTSVSRKLSVEYTAKKRWGSEILTYTLEYLQKLIDINYKNVRGEMYHKYQNLYGFLRIYSSPLLVEIRGLSYDNLLNEDGSPVDSKTKNDLQEISTYCSKNSSDEILPRINFRLKKVVDKENIRVSLINVKKRSSNSIDNYELYQLMI